MKAAGTEASSMLELERLAALEMAADKAQEELQSICEHRSNA